MVKHRDGAEQRDSEGRVEQEICDEMHVFDERVSVRVDKVDTTPKTRMVCLVDPGRGWPSSSHGKEATLPCPSSHKSIGRNSSQQRRLGS